MSVALKLVGVSPASNPDTLIFEGTFTGNAGVQGTGDQLNLAPYDAGNNPTGWTNPNGIEAPAMPVGLDVGVGVQQENIGGYYVQPEPTVPGNPSNGVAPSIALKTGAFLRSFAPGGAELGTGVAYPAAMTGGAVLLEVVLPKNQ